MTQNTSSLLDHGKKNKLGYSVWCLYICTPYIAHIQTMWRFKQTKIRISEAEEDSVSIASIRHQIETKVECSIIILRKVIRAKKKKYQLLN